VEASFEDHQLTTRRFHEISTACWWPPELGWVLKPLSMRGLRSLAFFDFDFSFSLKKSGRHSG
jgi:hypothetical protein